MNEPIDRLIQQIVSGSSPAELVNFIGNVNLNQVGMHGRTPLMVASCIASLPVAEWLMKMGASAQGTGHFQMTALHEAAAEGATAIASLLLSEGAEVDAASTQGVTPIMCAAAFGHVEVVRLLLAKGADAGRRDTRGFTAEDSAREKGEEDAASLISEYLAKNG